MIILNINKDIFNNKCPKKLYEMSIFLGASAPLALGHVKASFSYVLTYVRTYVCMYGCMYVCVCRYIFMRACMAVCVYA